MRDPRIAGTTPARLRTAAAVTLFTLLLAGPAGAITIGQWGAEVGVGGWTQDFDWEGIEFYDPSKLQANFTAGGFLDLLPQVPQRRAAPLDRAFVRRLQVGHHAEERGLAGAVRAHQSDADAVADGPRDVP